MEFRRSGNRDERRRRVLMDEAGQQAAGAPAAKDDASVSPARTAAAPVQAYTEAALSPRQRRVIDVIPTRRWTILVLLIVALSLVAALESLYGYLALEYTALKVHQIPAIDLARAATWGRG